MLGFRGTGAWCVANLHFRFRLQLSFHIASYLALIYRSYMLRLLQAEVSVQVSKHVRFRRRKTGSLEIAPVVFQKGGFVCKFLAEWLMC